MATLQELEDALRNADAAGDADAARALADEIVRVKGAGAPAAAAEPPAEPGWLDTIMSGASAVGGVLDQGARGFAEGVVNLSTLPNSIATLQNRAMRAGARALGAPEGVQDVVGNISILEHIWPSSEQVLGAGDAVNNAIAAAVGAVPPNPVPDNVAERFANRIGEETGATALAAMPILGKAASLISQHGARAPQVAREGGRLSRMFIEPATVNPARFLGQEMKMATGAGTGAAVAGEVFPDSPVAEIGGAVAGAGATAMGESLLRSGGEIVRAIFGADNYVDDVVRARAADTLVDAARIPRRPGEPADTTDLVEQIMSGPRIDQTVLPGVQESLADRTRNPGLANFEYARQSNPDQGGAFAQRRQQNARAIDEAMTRIEPKGAPAALREELAIERDRQLTDAGIEALNAQEEASRATAPLTPRSTSTARGNTVRGALTDARDAARQRTSEAYDAADVAQRPMRAADLVETIKTAMTGMAQAERANIPEGLIARIQQIGDGPATLREATALRSELQEMQVAARARPGGRNEARVLGVVERAVDDFIYSQLPPDQQEALTAARVARHAEGEAFDRAGDPVNRALAEYPGGRPRMSDERVARSFTSPEAMDRLFAQADTPEVRAAIREEVLSGADLTRADRIEQFIGDNREQIGRFPGLEDELRDAAGARTREAAATTRRAELERSLGTDERPGRSTVGKYLQFSDANSDKAIREVLSARDPARAADELLSFVGDDPKAVEGARKALWDNMAKASRRAGETTKDMTGAQQWMPEALNRWLSDPRNRAVAERFYRDDPEHLANIEKIAQALQGLDLRNTARVPNTSGSAQSILPSTETLASRSFAYQRGQVGLGFLATSLGAVIGRKAVARAQAKGVERMVTDALLDPDTAALLLRENNPANRAALGRKAKLWFGNEASKVLNAMSADDEDETEGAINGE